MYTLKTHHKCNFKIDMTTGNLTKGFFFNVSKFRTHLFYKVMIISIDIIFIR